MTDLHLWRSVSELRQRLSEALTLLVDLSRMIVLKLFNMITEPWKRPRLSSRWLDSQFCNSRNYEKFYFST